ncbi:MAG: CPBP family intramembrane glutamic endopeptidase [Spirochaetales bacterium]
MTVRKEFALLFSVLFLPGIVSQFGGVDGSLFESLYYNLQLLVVSIPQILLVISVSELRKPGSAESLGWRAPMPRDAIYAVICLVVLFFTSIGASLLASLVSPLDGMASEAYAWQFSSYELTPVVLISMLAVGYREELFFRAYLFDRGAEIDASPTTILIGSSLLFSLGHAYQGVAGVIVTLVLGFVLGALYMRFRNVHAVAIGHGLYNLSMLLLSGTVET